MHTILIPVSTLKKNQIKDEKCPNERCYYRNGLIFRNEDDSDNWSKWPNFIIVNKKNGETLHLPCCFWNRSKQTRVAGSVGIKNSSLKKLLEIFGKIKKTTKSSKYIIKNSEKLEPEQYGLLPEPLNSMFNGGKNPPEKIITGLDFYFRLGSGNEQTDKKQIMKNNFLYAIEKISKTENLIDSIIINLTEREFKSLNNGELELIFKDIDTRISPFQNFLEYLYSDEIKDYQLFWELVTKPNNWLWSNSRKRIGRNLFILELVTKKVDSDTELLGSLGTVENEIHIICPEGWDYTREKINKVKECSILIKKDDYYFEILTHRTTMSWVKTKRSLDKYDFQTSDNKIKEIIELYDNCKFLNDLVYYKNAIKLSNLNKKLYELKKDDSGLKHPLPTIDDIIDIFHKKVKKGKGKGKTKTKAKTKAKAKTIIDYFVLEDASNKIIGAVINYDKDQIYIPVYPKGRLYNDLKYGEEFNDLYKYDKQFSKLYKLSLSKTLKILKEIWINSGKTLHVKPNNLLIDDGGNLIEAVLLINGSIVPVTAENY